LAGASLHLGEDVVDNHGERLDRLASALAQLSEDLREALWTLHNLNESSRHARMVVEVHRAYHLAGGSPKKIVAKTDNTSGKSR
jgi:hypothetical protein